MAKFCTRCGARMEDADYRCYECGFQVEQQKKKKKWLIPVIIGGSVFLLVFIFIIWALLSSGSDDYEYAQEDEEVTYDTEGDDDDDQVINQTATGANDETWVVYWYLCGTDLESEGGMATQNLASVANMYQFPENVTLVIEAGGTKQWQNSEFQDGMITRYIWDASGSQAVQVLNDTNMSASNTLEDFLNFANANYSADHKMFLFWDHGGGSLDGAICDEMHEGDSLTIDEMYEAFANSCQLDENNPPFDIVGFDCCLMSTLDVANVFSDIGRYLVASEELEPGSGWDYGSWLTAIGNTPSITPEQVGKAICDSYLSQSSDYGVDEKVTLSVTDLSKIGSVVNAYDSMGLSMIKITANQANFYTEVARTAAKTKSFGDSGDGSGSTGMIDLGDFAKRMSGVCNEAGDVLAALDECIVYDVKGPKAGNPMGLSMYYNTDGDIYSLDNFMKLGAGSSFKYFYSLGMTGGDFDDAAISYLADNGVQAQDLPTIQNLQSLGVSQVPVYYSDDENAYINVGPDIADILSSVCYQLYYVDRDNDYMVCLGSDDELTFDWEQGIFHEEFAGAWGMLNDIPAYMDLVYASDEYNEYNVPIKVDGRDANLTVYYDFDSGSWEIGNACYVSPEGEISRDVITLKPGMNIEVLGYVASVSGDDDFEEYVMGEFTYSNDVEFSMFDLGSGEYILRFYLEDTQGNSVYSDEIYIEIDENGIYYQQ